MDNLYTPDLVPLELIDSNPWQTRLEEDDVHVMTLARDIAANTLLQPGLGRRLDGRVQIAFAHSRLAAFKFLNVTGDAVGHFSEFPVIIRELSDRQMSDYAAAENAKRKNLTAIEVASAIQKRIADFGLTQLEAGAPFGYVSQSSVAHLLSLLELPELARNLINERLLPERHGRSLVPFSKIDPEKVNAIADKVAQAPESARDEVFEDEIQDVVEEHGQRMLEDRLWAGNWHPDELPACMGCDYRIKALHAVYCMNPACYQEKAALWTLHELQRLGEKLNLPIATEGGPIKPLKIEWGNEQAARGYLKRIKKPDLYLLPVDAKDGDYHQAKLLETYFVVLGSTNPKLFDKSDDDKSASGKSVAADVSSGVEETPAARAKRIEREEAEAEERREARSAIRKARYDLVWLIMHNAEMLAVDLPITGGIATYCAELTQRYTTNPQYEWPEYEAWFSPLRAKMVGAMNCIRRDGDDFEKREFILARRFADGISGYKAEEQFNWTRGCKEVQTIAEELGLALPKDWDQPPVHKTKTNCHVCGVFTPGPTITGKDVERGWKAEAGVVTCSDACRDKLDLKQVKEQTKAFFASKPGKIRRTGKSVKKVASKRSKK